MVSSRPDWGGILREAAQNVHRRVAEVLPRRSHLELGEFKHLLDARAQEAIIDTLTRNDVSARLISEEGDHTILEGDFVVVADPVDGTTNLGRGLPPAVTSISVSETPRQSGSIAAVVMGLFSGEVYYAERGKGAFLGGEPIHPADPRTLDTALISMDVSKRINVEAMKPIIREARHLRQLGCSAISLCHVASGVVDAHVDIRGTVRATDISAGLLILREAGGIYSIDGVPDGDMPLARETRLSLIAASGRPLLKTLMDMTTLGE